MSTTAADLLRLLESTATPQVRPGNAGAPLAAGSDFASMLTKAQSGQLSSGRQVTLSPKANVSLTPDQLMRLSVAADQAEAQGATRALVFMDGMALHVNLTTRECSGQVDLSSGGVLTDVDAVVGVPSAGGGKTAPSGARSLDVLPLPSPGVAPTSPSLLKLLASQLTGAR